MKSVDVHQHLWPDEVLQTLESRMELPRAVWGGRRWRVDLPGEPSFDIDPSEHDPERRAGALAVDQALVALSAPVGVESLPLRAALPAVEAWAQAARALPASLGWWSAVPSGLPAQEAAELVGRAISDGAAGVCIPATRLATPSAAETTLGLLEAVAHADGTVFVHPGPTTERPVGSAPGWWAPATAYVAQQHAAWHAFQLVARPELPELRVIFALLAGLAPLHAERTAQRSDRALDGALTDPLTFYDTSSYGPRATSAMASAVGIAQLVHGSDYPVAPAVSKGLETAFGPELESIVRRDAPARALGREGVLA